MLAQAGRRKFSTGDLPAAISHIRTTPNLTDHHHLHHYPATTLHTSHRPSDIQLRAELLIRDGRSGRTEVSIEKRLEDEFVSEITRDCCDPGAYVSS